MLNEVQLTEAQIDAIVDRAVEKTFNRVYQEVGKSILTKMAWLTGAGPTVWTKTQPKRLLKRKSKCKRTPRKPLACLGKQEATT